MTIGQNTSSAVMAQRRSSRNGLDFFPTFPWATRAFLEHVFRRIVGDPAAMSVWEPAAGEGHMVRVLAEAFGTVYGSDVADYAAEFPLFDFLSLADSLPLSTRPFPAPDWIITNPPFKNFDQWVLLALSAATRGIAILGRIQMLEGETRFDDVWSPWRDHTVAAVYAERVPFKEGRIDPKGSSASAYGWLLIDKEQTFPNPVPSAVTIPTILIPKSRPTLERPGDYSEITA